MGCESALGDPGAGINGMEILERQAPSEVEHDPMTMDGIESSTLTLP